MIKQLRENKKNTQRSKISKQIRKGQLYNIKFEVWATITDNI